MCYMTINLAIACKHCKSVDITTRTHFIGIDDNYLEIAIECNKCHKRAFVYVNVVDKKDFKISQM